MTSRQQGGTGNLANARVLAARDPASKAGRKGGQSTPDEKRSSAPNHERASDAGRKGGER